MINELQTAAELQIFWDGFIHITLLISFFIMFGTFLGLIYTEKHRNIFIIGCSICCAYVYFILVWNFTWPLIYGYP
ncbi:MAG: hypothetical protein EAX96_18890 [Candidatus Lokiarchaeota archaeon]|nr:hypothetical protein [Candidatus Lokiarchaeota archaeon]